MREREREQEEITYQTRVVALSWREVGEDLLEHHIGQLAPSGVYALRFIQLLVCVIFIIIYVYIAG